MTDGRSADDRLSELDDFEALVARYVDSLRTVRNLADNSVRAYGNDLDSYLRWVRREGVRPLGITQRQLRRYLAQLSRAGYDPHTVNRHLSAIRGLYKWLLAEGITERDAAAVLVSPKATRRLPTTMTDNEVGRIIATCDDTTVGIRDRAFLELLYASGARISEISRLDLGDVDFSQSQVRLFGKGSKERIVPLYARALEALRAYLKNARAELRSKRRRGEEREALFLSTRGNRMSADALRTVFERRVALAGVDEAVTPHAMRHTYATELVSGGADLRSVQELLGHESLSTTQIYTHLSIERLKDAARQAHPRAE